jgi:YHS domain-containing protein
MKKILFALTIACALVVSAAAHDPKKHVAKKPAGKTATQAKIAKTEFLGKGDGVTTCPVTGEELHNKDIKANFFGRTVYFCCPGCLDEAKKQPAAYVKKTHKEQLLAIKNVKPEEHGHHGEHQDKAADGEAKFLGKGDGIETCPVTGEPVNKNLKYEVAGKTFYVCCEGCGDTVKKNPSAYLKGVETKAAFLGKGDGIETCPVTGEPVNKSLKHEVNGQTFYVCCDGCAETVKNNPAAYLKKADK